MMYPPRMRVVVVLLVVSGCGSQNQTAVDHTAEPTGTEATASEEQAAATGPRCLPFVDRCGCATACGMANLTGQTDGLQVSRTGLTRPAEASLQQWCRGDDCRDAFVAPRRDCDDGTGFECVQTTAYDGCHLEGVECVQDAKGLLRSQVDEMLAAIGEWQEGHRAQFGQYQAHEEWLPAEIPAYGEPVPWPAEGAIGAVGRRAVGETTSFQYQVLAGNPGQRPLHDDRPWNGGRVVMDLEDGLEDEENMPDFWYVVHARGYMEPGGDPVTLWKGSFRAQIGTVD